MNFLSGSTRPGLRSAMALSLLLALGACSSDDDDDGDPSGMPPEDDALEVTLSPDQEVPPVTDADAASGEASISVGEDGTVSGSITVEGLTGPAQAAHIHRGFRGSNGPVVIGLVPADGSDPTADGADVTEWSVPEEPELTGGATSESITEAYARGELYFNVHTVANPGGEIRGQIVPEGDAAPTFFTVRIENVSTTETLATSAGSVAVPLSPGAYIVHRGDASPLFESGAAASEALEMVAEDGDPAGYTAATGVPGAAVFNTPVDATEAGPIGPGDAYEFTVSAVPGDKLSLVTMFIESNDYFYTLTDEDDSLSLFDEDGNPVTGNQSAGLALWDAGTEQDEALGEGPNQAPRQAAPDTGPDEGANAGSLAGQGETVDLNGDVISLTVTPEADAATN